MGKLSEQTFHQKKKKKQSDVKARQLDKKFKSK